MLNDLITPQMRSHALKLAAAKQYLKDHNITAMKLGSKFHYHSSEVGSFHLRRWAGDNLTGMVKP